MCKYFGSMLDTKKDIKWRNAVNAANIIQVIFNNTKLTPKKNDSFQSLYQTYLPLKLEIWTITSSQAENTINAFQQRLIRTYVLNVKWPNTVRNEEVYRRKRAIKLNTTV